MEKLPHWVSTGIFLDAPRMWIFTHPWWPSGPQVRLVAGTSSKFFSCIFSWLLLSVFLRTCLPTSSVELTPPTCLPSLLICPSEEYLYHSHTCSVFFRREMILWAGTLSHFPLMFWSIYWQALRKCSINEERSISVIDFKIEERVTAPTSAPKLLCFQNAHTYGNVPGLMWFYIRFFLYLRKHKEWYFDTEHLLNLGRGLLY